MKKYATALIIFCFCFSSFAQDKIDRNEQHKEKREEIQSQKIAFITTYLDLTPEESQVFWPVYNEYNKKITELSIERIKLMKQVKEAKTTLTEKDAETIGDRIIDSEVNEVNLKKEYHLKYKKILPKVKIVMLYQAEHKFKKQLLQKMKGTHHDQGHNQDVK